MLYEELWVKSAVETEISGEKYLICNFVGHNLDVTARVCLSTTKRQNFGSILTPGKLIHCEFAYQMHNEYIVLGIVRFKIMQGYNLSSNQEISSEEYMNPNRGYWVYSSCISPDWIQFPDGILTLEGNAYLSFPNFLLNNGHLSYKKAKGYGAEEITIKLGFFEKCRSTLKIIFS